MADALFVLALVVPPVVVVVSFALLAIPVRREERAFVTSGFTPTEPSRSPPP